MARSAEYLPSLSKSKYLAGLQCPKLLWHHYHAREKFPPTDEGTQAIFDQGHVVGKLAHSLFPGGIEIEADYKNINLSLRLTQEFLSKRTPLFESAAGYKNAYARADILDPVEKYSWDIIEVKSSTSVKDVNLADLALQRYAYEGAGIPIRKCFLMHINPGYVRKGEIQPEALFSRADVTEEVNVILSRVESDLEQMTKVIRRKTSPEVPIGSHCSVPYVCPLTDMCWDFLPEHNPTTLYRLLSERAFELICSGVTSLRKLPLDMKLNEKQRIQVDAIRHNKPYTDKEAIVEFLESLHYPLYFVDFETIAPAIPLFNDASPYRQIPFQFSLHVQRTADTRPEQYGFLAAGRSDPRKEFLDTLKELLGSGGSVVAYNASFELSRLDELTELFPSYRSWYNQIKARTVDLLQPFRDFAYYHPEQQGSASLKAVLPALTGEGYTGMKIADGGTASNQFLRVTFCDVSEEERRTVRSQLEAYCTLDTEGMWKIVEKLRTLAS